MILDGMWSMPKGKLVYRLLPKCGCSSIGQMLHYASYGKFFDGDIHDLNKGLLKAKNPKDQPKLLKKIKRKDTVIFTAVRNPYRRILSAFFDKIAGQQRDGTVYCYELYHKHLAEFGVAHGAVSDDPQAQIAAFRGFVKFAAQTLIYNPPVRLDIHWNQICAHIRPQIAQGVRFTHMFHLETMHAPLQGLLDQYSRYKLQLSDVPHFNPSGVFGPKQMAPTSDYFDDETIAIIQKTYARDFALMRYDPNDPTVKMPIDELDLDEIHKVLTDISH